MNPDAYRIVMSNRPDLDSDPDILPSLSPVSREHVGNSGIAYDTGGTNVVDFGLTRMLPKNRVIFVHQPT
jgi:hypothetical protein